MSISGRFDEKIEETDEEQTLSCRLFLNLWYVLKEEAKKNFESIKTTQKKKPISAELFALAIWLSIWSRREADEFDKIL